MKHIRCLSSIFLFFVMSYSCQKNISTPYFVIDNYTIFTGKVVGVFCPACDTSYDTIRIRINRDTVNGSEIQIKINKFYLKSHDLLLKTCTPFNDSLMLRQRIKCNPSELIIKPLRNLNLPSQIDTVVVIVYGLGADCSYIPERFGDDLIGNMVLVSGTIGTSSVSTTKAHIRVNYFSNYLIFFKQNIIEQNYNFTKSTTFNSLTPENGINLDFELAKELIFLMKEEPIKKRIEIVNNLMYHPYYLRDSAGFAKMVNYNLNDLQEQRRLEIIKTQCEISNKKKNFQ